MTVGSGGAWPALILAADHRARGVITIERYADYLDAIRAALPHCDGILASTQPLRDLVESGAVTSAHRTYLSINRTGLAGAPWELDDRLVATVARAAADGCAGVKIMTRIDLGDPHTADALELLGQVLDEARASGLEALVEAVTWRDGRMSHATDDIVHAAVIAHDFGAPLLKVPFPSASTTQDRVAAIARVVASVGVPVLFLGGPYRPTEPDAIVAQAGEVVAGGGAGLAVGRAILNDADPGAMAERVAAAIRDAVAA
jgi:DhnA family fructose-bisphosphate aldolase class Ia